MSNEALYMTVEEQRHCLEQAGVRAVTNVLQRAGLVLHRALNGCRHPRRAPRPAPSGVPPSPLVSGRGCNVQSGWMSAHRGDLGLAIAPLIHGFCSDPSVDCRIAGAPPPHDVQRLPLIGKEDDVAWNCFASFVLVVVLASPAAAAQGAGSALAT